MHLHYMYGSHNKESLHSLEQITREDLKTKLLHEFEGLSQIQSLSMCPGHESHG